MEPGAAADQMNPTHPSATNNEDVLLRAVMAPLPAIEAYMRAYVEGLDAPGNLIEALLYALLGPGKRVRPLLAWHCARAASPSGQPEACLAAACAVEMVHAFSLVHDDLPGLDNDDLRRGRPTLHRHTNEAMAILAGDSLLTLSFAVLVEKYPAALGAALVSELASGTNAMIAGQIYDTLGGFPLGLSDEDKLRLIHRNKTGALIRAACRMGAMSALGGAAAEPSRLASITAYAEAIGLMFQIVDDVLDVTQSTMHLGKKSGKDIDAGKLTYPGVLGLEASRERVRELHEVAIEALRPLGETSRPLADIADYLAVRTR